MLQLAQDPHFGIAAGLEITYPDQAIQSLASERLATSTAKIPSFLELALAIEWEIRLLQDSTSIWKPLFSYLQAQPHAQLSPKSERRLVALAENLAHLFMQYGKYGGTMLSEWEQQPLQEWQQALWNKLFCTNNLWTYPYRAWNLDEETKVPHDTTVHLFSLSFLPRLQHDFLERLSHYIPVYYYMLSPCQAFWSDIRSEKESRHLQSYWKKHGASIGQQLALESYLKDCNPLLANFGRLGREMAQQIEESNAVTSSCYSIPSTAMDVPSYEALVDDDIAIRESNTPLTLLEGIQTDLLLFRNPATSEKIALHAADHSVQVHAAPTPLREVETLYDVLLGLIQKHAKDEKPLTPSDILVMAPEIMDYDPFIRMVFGAATSALDAQIMDLSVPTQHPLVQGFLHLLALPDSRWDAATLLQLFDSPAFQKKQMWSEEELQQVQKWIKNAGIRWGLDSSHRNDILQRHHCTRGMLDRSSTGTWEFGLSRLLMGLVMQTSDQEALSTLIVGSQAELLGELIQLMRSLRHELTPLHDGTQKSLKEWSQFLKTLLSTNFFVEDDEAEKLLLSHLDSFARVEGLPAEVEFSFTSIKKYLLTALSQQTVTYRESHLHAIRFCTLLPMRTIPAQVIVLLGMHEGAFPKRDQTMSLNHLHINPHADYTPTQTDFDRYLFLEALLSARRYFILSYTNFAPEDYQEQYPSLLVSELLNYIDKGFHSEGRSPSSLCQHEHPYRSYDRTLFEKECLFPSFSTWNYQNACAYYRVDKEKPHRFVPQFPLQFPLKAKEPLRIEMHDIHAFARNPLKTYFNKTLGIYLEKEENHRVEVNEKFQLSHLDIDLLKKKALNIDIDRLLQNAENAGILPLGLFKDISLSKVQQEIQELFGTLRRHGVDPSTWIEIEFSERFNSPRHVDQGHWQLPPLKIQGPESLPITLVGKLTDVSPEGLVVHQRAEKSEIVKAWPHFLIYHTLIQTYNLPVQPAILFAKSGHAYSSFTESPRSHLEKYLGYYVTGLSNASPLIPEWIPLVISTPEHELEKLISDSLSNPFKELYNDYIHWSLPGAVAPDTTSIVRYWKAIAEDVYGELLKQWVKK